MDLILILVNIFLALAMAPLLNGVIKKSKAGWQNRLGPSIFQPWFDIMKYLCRESVVSQYASWLYRVAPYIYFGSHLAAAALVPTILAASPLAGVGDMIMLVGLLALGRFFLALAALDTASNFGGMGTSREMAFAVLVEPALLLALFAVAIPAGSTDLGALVGDGSLTMSRLLAAGALAIIVVAETGRIPVDNPDTHLELTMAHEGMILEYSGRPLGLLLWGTHVKQLVIISLFAAIFVPWGIARDLTGISLLVGTITYLVKLGLIGLALAVFESTNVKLRIFRVPEFLGTASLLGLLAVTSIYLLGG